jgi:hypothetical protein
MAVSASKILSLSPTILKMLLPGFFNPAGTVGRYAARGLARKGMAGAAFDYPAMTEDFYYPVIPFAETTTVEGQVTKLPALNRDIMRGQAGSALVQTLQQHNRGIADGTEPHLKQWWPGEDKQPRIQFNPSSSAVKSVRITTDNKIQVQFKNGNGKWYTYRGGDDLRETTEAAKDLLTAPSIGRAVARMAFGKYPTRYRHTDSKDLLGPKQQDPELGWWGYEHYDPTAV